MTSGTANGGGGPTSQGLNSPEGLLVAQGRLFVADRTNNRVLVWNTIPAVTAQPADLVLGQPNMISNGVNGPSGIPSAQTLNTPAGLSYDGQRLFISDSHNNRIVGYNSLPTITDQAADFVLGQPNMSSVLANQGGVTSALTLSTPIGLFYNDNVFGVWTPSGY
jgi:hypothetical protein